MKIRGVDQNPSFSKLEEETLKYWEENRTFQKSLEKTKGGKDYVFYDGPPFATGLPHYGHILTSYIKDVVPRYFTMNGFFVDRRWGWDCHGLPVEFEIEKKMAISGKKEIEELGVGKFNEQCRGIVLNYADEWERIITRLGRWVDFRRQYKTMDLAYMETVMWAFSELYKKGLVYESPKVVPYCIRCQTPLSNFEAGQDDSYREKDDPAVTVTLKLEQGQDEHLLIWTTTPWTLPSNVAVAVNKDMDYRLYRDAQGRGVWVAAERAEHLKSELEGWSVEKTAKGSSLVGRHYEPALDYFPKEGRFRVIEGDFVTSDTGTGFVHLAPAFGEDDARACQREGIRGEDPLGIDGKFGHQTHDLLGLDVFTANKQIIKKLKGHGSLFKLENHKHNYPHCWRCDTPLIYRGVGSWFVKVTAVKDRLVENNRRINWIPPHIRDGRFGLWLEGARDWAISRNRFWGSPLPVWKCSDCGDVFVPSSIGDLEKKSGGPVADLHRPACDEIRWKCNKDGCGGEFRRVPEVLDCWFESGSMPFAQEHYPFENTRRFQENFPADFIVEYVSQTRGWFYTLVVLSTALFDKEPFKNSLCHGVILAEDGRKMSKRLKNYPDPMETVEKYGSDALRISLASSPVVKGLDIRFSEKLVREAARRYVIPLWNTFHFFTAYASLMGDYEPKILEAAEALDDRHILSELEELRAKATASMEVYDLPKVYAHVLSFIETLSTWYVRNNRHRYWGSELTADMRAALDTLYTVLVTLSRISAPFIPFLAERIHLHLTGESAHLADWPPQRDEWKDDRLREEIGYVRRVIEGARVIREKHSVGLRQPLASALVAGVRKDILDRHEDLIKSQANVKDLAFAKTPDEFAAPKVEVDSKKAGPVLKGDVKAVVDAGRAGKFERLDDGSVRIGGHVLEPKFFRIEWVPLEKDFGSVTDAEIVVCLDLRLNDALLTEGASRDLNRIIQDMRKEMDLPYEQRITLDVHANGLWEKALNEYGDWLDGEALVVETRRVASADGLQNFDNDKGKLSLRILPKQ
ncbi:MAG: isoleucine--tRNA ligase [Nitrospinae bacterium]|nr:isoleucine--tRNA ligase [Nitrospinota bacterium]